MQKTRTLADVKADLDAKVMEGNKAITENQPLTIAYFDGFAILEKEFADLTAEQVYTELMTEEVPMIAAIKRYSFQVVRHQEVRDSKTKEMTEIKLVEKDKQIDLLKFAKFGKLDTSWEYVVAAYNQSLCLRAAQEMGYSPREIKDLACTYHLAKQAKELADGKTPTSNTKMVKMLQGVIDAILPPADEEEGNAFKCNNHDTNFLLMCYTKKGRKALSIAIARDGNLRSLIMDVLHRIVEGKLYSIEYKTKKDAIMVRSVIEADVEPSQDDILDELFADEKSA